VRQPHDFPSPRRRSDEKLRHHPRQGIGVGAPEKEVRGCSFSSGVLGLRQCRGHHLVLGSVSEGVGSFLIMGFLIDTESHTTVWRVRWRKLKRREPQDAAAIRPSRASVRIVTASAKQATTFILHTTPATVAAATNARTAPAIPVSETINRGAYNERTDQRRV
jgi:hypothetical protein